MLFESRRLLVRAFTADDLDNFYLLASDARAMRFIRPVISREAARQTLEQEIAGYLKHPHFGRFAIIEKDGGAYIGNFLLRPSSFMAGTEIGYAVLPDAWGKGYSTELTQRGLLFAFNDLCQQRMYAVTHPDNNNAKKVLLKCGFVQRPNFKDAGVEKTLFEIN